MVSSSIQYSSHQDFEWGSARLNIDKPVVQQKIQKVALQSPASGYTCIEAPRIDGWKE
jgi:hypothetical protein